MERYQNIVANSNTGLPVNGAQVYVLDYGTSTQASIYSDNGITLVTQPLRTDSLGSFFFYAANGHYTLTVYTNGVLVATIPDVLLQDAQDNLVVDITGGTINATTVGATTPSTGAFTAAAISGGTIDGATIGGTTPAVGSFTTLNSTAGTIAGAAITGATINSSSIGATTPAAGSFSSLNGGALGGRRNLVINGNFAVNQRVVSGTVTLAAGIYGHDRWKGGASGGTYTFAVSGIDTNLTISAGSIQQVIEGLFVAGTTYTLSWTGAAQGRFNGGTYASSPIAITGITAAANLTIEFNTGTVGSVQVEPGTAATPFERNPLPQEIHLCQRYYQKSFPLAIVPAQNAGNLAAEATIQAPTAGPGTVFFPMIRLIPRMSGSPTVTLYNPGAANAQARNLSNGTDCTASTTSQKNETGILMTCTSSGTTAAGHLIAVHWTAEAEL